MENFPRNYNVDSSDSEERNVSYNLKPPSEEELEKNRT